jgi:hypothetical protein
VLGAGIVAANQNHCMSTGINLETLTRFLAAVGLLVCVLSTTGSTTSLYRTTGSVPFRPRWRLRYSMCMMNGVVYSVVTRPRVTIGIALGTTPRARRTSFCSSHKPTPMAPHPSIVIRTQAKIDALSHRLTCGAYWHCPPAVTSVTEECS